MPDCGEQQALRYSAFISYSHRDAAFARRLHRDLENYRLPRRIAERQNAGRGGARRLRPIFRDREELSAAPDLSRAVQQAIEEASYLIVICSRHSSTSTWVARELALFRDVHGEGAILAALVDGADEGTLHSIFAAGASVGRVPEPLAADFRKDGDGGRLALLKLVAVLADVRLDELVQRDAQRRVRQVTAVSVAALAGMTLMTVLALVAINARDAVVRERSRGEAVIGYMLTDLRSYLASRGMLAALEMVNQGAIRYYANQDLRDLSDTALEQRAALLQAIGNDDLTRGNLHAAKAQFDESRRTTAALLVAKPNDPDRIFAEAQSDYWVGLVYLRLGDEVIAKAMFSDYLFLAERLFHLDPNNPRWLLEVGYALSNLGSFVFLQSIDTVHAEPLLRTALEDFQRVAVDGSKKKISKIPDQREMQIQIADGYAWLADVEFWKGNYATALQNREEERTILQKLLAEDARDFEVRSALTGNTLGFARIAAARGNLRLAMEQLEKGHTDASALSQEERENAEILQEVRIFELFEVRVSLSMRADERPSDAAIAKNLGDCASERAKQDNEEIASFCTALEGRICVERGDRQRARALYSLIKQNGPGARLTEKWRINIKTEIHLNSLTEVNAN